MSVVLDASVILKTLVQEDGSDRADLVPDAISLSLQLDHALYDCLYLTLAVRLGIRLVTADRRFHDKLRTTEFAASMQPL